MSQSSLRRLLARALLLPLAVVIAVAAGADYFLSVRPGLSAYDQALADTVVALADHVRTVEPGTTPLLPPVAEKLLEADKYDQVVYQVRDARGRVVAGDDSLPGPPTQLSPDEPLFFDSRLAAQPVRVAAMWVDRAGERLSVQVAETIRKRDRLLQQVLVGIVLPDIVLGVLIAAVIWFGVARGLAPLETLCTELAARSHTDLRPLPSDQAPSEVQPLLDEINDLLSRLREAGQAQQRFLANAAHQLRTPLAALGALVELAKRQSGSPGLPGILEDLEKESSRTAHIANQLLALARAEPGGHSADALRPLDLRDVVNGAADVWVGRALQKDIDLGFEAAPAPVQADALLVQELLANLLDNAIRYTPPHGVITVRSLLRDECPVLEVEDNGIGIPEGERTRVLERFYRVNGTPGQGSGLGLAIVKEIANAHDATIAIHAPAGRGTVVTVRFPRGNPDPGQPGQAKA